MVVSETVSGRLAAGAALPRERPGHADPAPLPLGLALLTIGGLSAGLWLGIFWLAAALF